MSEQNEAVEIDAAGIASGLTGISIAIHQMNVEAGWWTDINTGEPRTEDMFFIASKMLLIHSEISEAAEALRKGLMDDKLPHRNGVEVELADAVIRIFDLAGALGFDIGAAMVEKIAYNHKRADHKVENRAKDGGKTF